MYKYRQKHYFHLKTRCTKKLIYTISTLKFHYNTIFNLETVQKVRNLVHFDQREKSHNIDYETPPYVGVTNRMLI